MRDESDKVLLTELVITAWRYKYWFALIGAIFCTLVAIYTLTIPDQYRSEVLVAATEDADSGALGALGGRLGALAGINLPAASTSKMDIALAMIKSRGFLVDYIEDRDLLPLLYAVEEWDSEDEELVYDTAVYDPETSEWQISEEAMIERRITPWFAAENLAKNYLEIDREAGTGLVRIAMYHQSPGLSASLLNDIVEYLNARLRERDRREALRAINFLEERAASRSDTAEVRNLSYGLMEEQLGNLLLAEVKAHYALEVIDRALQPEVKARPNRTFMVIAAALVAAILCFLVLLVVVLVKPSRV